MANYLVDGIEHGIVSTSRIVLYLGSVPAWYTPVVTRDGILLRPRVRVFAFLVHGIRGADLRPGHVTYRIHGSGRVVLSENTKVGFDEGVI